MQAEDPGVNVYMRDPEKSAQLAKDVQHGAAVAAGDAGLALVSNWTAAVAVATATADWRRKQD